MGVTGIGRFFFKSSTPDALLWEAPQTEATSGP